ANAGVVAQRPARSPDKRAGRHVTVDDLGDRRTCQSTAGSALRVGRQAGGGAVTLVAGSETGDQKNRAGKTEEDGSLHSFLPVLWTRIRAVDDRGAHNIT